MNFKELSAQFENLLDLKTPPVAVAFKKEAPTGVSRVESSGPAGCSYWKLAAEGRVFYTQAEDHYACPVGAHTHNVALPPETAKELESLVGTMVGLEYLKLEDIPAIPRRKEPFAFAVYAPLSLSPGEPDVVLIRGKARALMLLSEAAQSAGAAGAMPAMGRPTCAILPETLNSGKTAASFGCVGNRVYTGAGDDEAYFSIPGAQLAKVAERLAVICQANQALLGFHRSRQAAV